MTYNEAGNFDAAYTYGIERIEVKALDDTRPESQDPLYYLYDGLGSVTFMVKPDGNMRDHYRYDEFGKPAPGNSKLSEDGRNVLHNTFGYTGEMWDQESELLYLRARYYKPETGRFLSRDSYEGNLQNPLSRHLYAYVGNSPVNFVDPTGHLQQGDELLPTAAYELITQYTKEYNEAPDFIIKVFGRLDLVELNYIQNTVHQKAEYVRELCRSQHEPEKMIYKLWLLSNPEDRIFGRKEVGGADTSFNLSLKRLHDIEKVNIMKLDLKTLDNLYIDAENAELLAIDIATIAAHFRSFKGTVNTIVDNRKFSDYIFKEGADHGKDVVFRNLGYSKEHTNELVQIYQKQATKKYLEGQYTLGKYDQYGQRIEIEIELKGIGDATGKKSYLKSGWLIQEDGSIKLNTTFTGFTR